MHLKNQVASELYLYSLYIRGISYMMEREKEDRKSSPLNTVKVMPSITFFKNIIFIRIFPIKFLFFL